LSDLFFNENVPDTEQEQSGCDNSNGGITADLLGLDELDTITRKIPDVFIGLKDEDPAGEHRKIVDNSLPDTPDEQRGKLVQFLSDLFRSAETTSGLAVILLSRDELLAHGISTVCRHDGVFVFATDVEQALDIIIEQSLGRDLHPLLLLDGTHEDSTEALMTLVQQKIVAYPQISVMITSCSPHIQNISMRALAAGTGTVMPRPCPQCHGEEYIQQLITFLSSLGQFFTKTDPLSTTEIDRQFVAALKQVKAFFEPPEIALLLLNFTATQFERVITFVVAKSELIAEKSIGVTGNKSKGPSPPLMFRIPLADHSLLQEVAEKGELYYGLRSDSALTTFLYKEIGAPRSPKTLLLPLISRGKVIALIYADFGSRAVSPPRIPLLEALAHYGAAILDNALYRKSLEKTA
jgi:hypothetical protein